MASQDENTAKILRITSRHDGFRRAGLVHPMAPTDHQVDQLTAKQIEILKAEPMLVVVEIDVEDEAAVAKAATAKAKADAKAKAEADAKAEAEAEAKAKAKADAGKK